MVPVLCARSHYPWSKNLEFPNRVLGLKIINPATYLLGWRGTVNLVNNEMHRSVQIGSSFERGNVLHDCELTQTH